MHSAFSKVRYNRDVLFFISSAVNSIIYGVFNDDFRQAYCKLFNRIFCCGGDLLEKLRPLIQSCKHSPSDGDEEDEQVYKQHTVTFGWVPSKVYFSIYGMFMHFLIDYCLTCHFFLLKMQLLITENGVCCFVIVLFCILFCNSWLEVLYILLTLLTFVCTRESN